MDCLICAPVGSPACVIGSSRTSQQRQKAHRLTAASQPRITAAACRVPSSRTARSVSQKRGLSLAVSASTTAVPGSSEGVARELCANSGLERVALKSEGWNYWTWKGHKVHYIAEGSSGSPIVLVHGFGAHAYHWRYQFPELSKKHRVYAICLLGYGWSDKPVAPYSSEYWGEQVADFIKEVVGEPAVLVGNSIGAIAALSAAYQDPAMITGLALLNAAGRFDNAATASAAEAAAAAEADADAAAAVEPEDTSIGAKLNEWWRRAVAQFIFLSTKVYVDKSKVDASLIQSIYRPACEPDAAEAFYQISGSGGRSKRSLNSLLAKMRLSGPSPKPLVLVWGMQDPWMQPSKARAILDLYPEAQLVEIPMGGHCPHDDDPKAVNDALLAWAAGLPPAAAAVSGAR